MKILVIGGGGREHALAWKMAQSERVDRVFVAPGNAGTAQEKNVQNIAIAAEDVAALLEFACSENIGLTVVGPEMPLVNGIVDEFIAAGLKIIGPSRAASQLEGSKAFTKDFLHRHNIPSAAYGVFSKKNEAIAYIRQNGAPIVVKADGLAAGKGVIVATNEDEAIAAVHDMLSGNRFGEAGSRVVIEEYLQGEEASFICLVGQGCILPMATSQDHKARDVGDSGPNTGGMGAYSPAPVVTQAIEQRVIKEVIEPTVSGMSEEGYPYSGFLYAGLMIDSDGVPKVLEYNCRFGDPETQPVMMRLKSDLVDLCLSSLDGRLGGVAAEWDERCSLGVVLAAGGYPENYHRGDVINNIPQAGPDSKVFHAGTASQDGETVTNGGRVLCACALGDTVVEAQRQAYELVDQISWDNMYCRRDIGYRAVARERSQGSSAGIPATNA